MRLAPGAGVPEHADINYHWHTRVRVHIPVFTSPAIRFHCGGRRKRWVDLARLAVQQGRAAGEGVAHGLAVDFGQDGQFDQARRVDLAREAAQDRPDGFFHRTLPASAKLILE